MSKRPGGASMRAARLGRVLGLGIGMLGLTGPAQADGAAEDAIPPPVGYDALFKLPEAKPLDEAARRGGATRKEWQDRFAAARSDVASAKARLSRTQKELEEVASGTENWQMAPPGGGGGGADNPLSYKLTQQIRRDRENVAEAERALTELRVEANLAGVPEDWQ